MKAERPWELKFVGRNYDLTNSEDCIRINDKIPNALEIFNDGKS
jgi:hypothetical protein